MGRRGGGEWNDPSCHHLLLGCLTHNLLSACIPCSPLVHLPYLLFPPPPLLSPPSPPPLLPPPPPPPLLPPPHPPSSHPPSSLLPPPSLPPLSSLVPPSSPPLPLPSASQATATIDAENKKLGLARGELKALQEDIPRLTNEASSLSQAQAAATTELEGMYESLKGQTEPLRVKIEAAQKQR